MAHSYGFLDKWFRCQRITSFEGMVSVNLWHFSGSQALSCKPVPLGNESIPKRHYKKPLLSQPTPVAALAVKLLALPEPLPAVSVPLLAQ